MEPRELHRSGGGGEGGGTQAIDRAVGLLRLVAAARNRGASLSELVDASGLVKPTCRRILVALIDAGLAEQDATTRRYFLGPEAYVLGTIAADRFGLQQTAREGVTRLARETGDAAFVQLRRDASVVCLHREDGDYPLRSHVLAAGDRHPLGAGAGGIALLAALPDAEIDAVMATNQALLAARYPVLTRPVVDDLVAAARADGYSLNRGLLFPGSWGMGMVVRDAQGRPDACLSIAAVESRMQPDRQPHLAELLRGEVRLLEARLRDFGARAEEKHAAGPARGTPARRQETKR